MKDIILKSNKDEVIYFALEYMEKDQYHEDIKYLISDSDDYICPINDKIYLSKIYDEMYSLARKEYKNENVERYKIKQGFGYPFGFDQFIDVVLTDEKLESTGKFIYIDNNINKKSELLPISFLINCKLDKRFLEENQIKIAALALLQVIYIQELNKNSN